MLNLLSNLFNLIGNVFGFQSKKLDINNTPEIKKRVEHQKEEDFKGKVENAIKDKDIKKIREFLAE